jgi:putative exosortase-associated protein (TIGR04073 family)
MRQAVRWLCIVGLLMAGLWTPPAAAYTPTPAPLERDQVDELMRRYNLHPAFGKLGRGVCNFFLGWTEIPLNIGKWYSRSDTGGSIVTGAAHGVFRGVVRTGVGFYETVTFFLPYPEDFAPILPTLEYFRQDVKRAPLPVE